MEENNRIWLSEAFREMDKKFHKYWLNILNGHAGSGKTKFIFGDFLENTYKYVDGIGTKKYSDNLDRVLYVCDTNMLKESILKETEEMCITKILQKGDLKKAIKNKTLEQILEGDIGFVKVITYSTLSFLLNSKECEKLLTKYFDCIIMDEMHNLIKYANRFDSDKKKTYENVIDYLPTLAQNLLLIGISATPQRIFTGLELRELAVISSAVFTGEELKRIKKYTEKNTYEFAYAINEIKCLNILKKFNKEHNYKILIYTNTVATCEKYKRMLIEYGGYKAEWLCSINNKIVNETTGKEELRMSEEQINIREQLIETGMLPEDLDVLIINAAYETGWNLRDKNIKMVIIDDLDYDSQIQARNRVRNDIEILRVKVPVDEDGEIIDYDQYKNSYLTGRGVIEYKLANCIEEKYIGVKLSTEDKKYLVDRYASRWCDKKSINWQTFRRDLKLAGLVVKTTNNGTYIYHKDDVIISEDKKVTVKKKDKSDVLINWIENKWDKSSITIQDIRDILDIGAKSFDNLIKSEKIIGYFKANRYTICSPRGTKTKYLRKY